MRKNQSKYKNKEYQNQLIENAIKFENITYKEIIDDYVYFNCSVHGEFRKRFDHLVEIKHNTCPKCSKQIYSKIVGQVIASKSKIEDYVDFDKYEPISNFSGATSKMTFKC